MNKNFIENEDWYRFNIEDPLKKIVKNLRNNGINTYCSCGHGRYIQCETYQVDDDLKTIFNVFVTMKIKKYRVNVFVDYTELLYHKSLEIQLPDENGNYYQIPSNNEKYIQYYPGYQDKGKQSST